MYIGNKAQGRVMNSVCTPRFVTKLKSISVQSGTTIIYKHTHVHVQCVDLRLAEFCLARVDLIQKNDFLSTCAH